MSYEYNPSPAAGFAIDTDRTGVPTVDVFDEETYMSASLSTDPDEVVKLLRAIVEATGTQDDIAVGRVQWATISTATSSRTVGVPAQDKEPE